MSASCSLEQLLAPPFAAATTSTANCLSSLPPIVRKHYQRIDAMPWAHYDLAIEAGGPLPRGSLAADDELLMTNPSVHCHNGRLLVAVRVMNPPRVQPPCTDIWRSRVIISRVAYEREERALVSRGCTADATPMFVARAAAAAERCASSGVEPSVGLGAEDPRFVSTPRGELLRPLAEPARLR